jgi:hypothetical protein
VVPKVTLCPQGLGEADTVAVVVDRASTVSVVVPVDPASSVSPE